MPEKCNEHCAGLDRLEQQVDELRRQNGTDHREFRERIGKIETSDAVQREQYETILEKLDALTHKVDALEAKPGRRWDGLVDKLIYAAALAVVAWLAAGAPGL